MMSKFRKKPVVIEATRWWQNGDHPKDRSRLIRDNDGHEVYTEGFVVRRFCRPDIPSDKVCHQCGHFMERHGWIDTLEGGHVVCPGDWIITGVGGEMYPCKPDIFAATYEIEEPEVKRQDIHYGWQAGKTNCQTGETFEVNDE